MAKLKVAEVHWNAIGVEMNVVKAPKLGQANLSIKSPLYVHI
jgi:hypothetical protein